MSILISQHGYALYITLDRMHKHNTIDEELISNLQQILDDAHKNPTLRAIVLNSNGPHFSAGADFAWMQRMATTNYAENLADAKRFAKLIYTLYHSPIPTIVMVQGNAIGGGAGLVAACDIAIAADNAQFCFSEVKWGLLPAMISPYVIKAIGARAAQHLFLSAERIDAQRALELQLVHYCVNNATLREFTDDYVAKLMQSAPQAIRATKALLHKIQDHEIDANIQEITAVAIAQQRLSKEGQCGISAFLNKSIPAWD